VILHVSDGPRAIKTDIPTSAAHGGTDYKELEIETVTKMEKLSRRLLFNVDSLPIKSFKMTYLNDAQRTTEASDSASFRLKEREVPGRSVYHISSGSVAG
jgi:hypothetical protein